MTREGTIPLSDIADIRIWFNTEKMKSTKANLKKILKEENGDIILSAAIFLRSGAPCCHLKADGKVRCRPAGYTAWAISWSAPADFAVEVAPNEKANYMACVKCIIGGRKVVMDYQPDMNYKAPRVAIGVKEGRFAYYATQDKLLPEALQDRLFDTGWHDAIMMDGGGSACCVDKNGNGFVGDGRVIPFFIIIQLKASAPSDNEPKGEKPKMTDGIIAYSLKKDGEKYLTKNFQVKEFACKDGNDTVFIHQKLPMVLQYIRMRAERAVNNNSAYRTEKYNASVGGAEFSQHLYGTAADIAVKGVAPKVLAGYAREIMSDWGGVGIYSWGIHVDVREEKVDWNG